METESEKGNSLEATGNLRMLSELSDNTAVFLPSGFTGTVMRGSGVSGFRIFSGDPATAEGPQIVSRPTTSDAFTHLLQPPSGPGAITDSGLSIFPIDRLSVPPTLDLLPKSSFSVTLSPTLTAETLLSPSLTTETSTESLPTQMTQNIPLQAIQPKSLLQVSELILIPMVHPPTSATERAVVSKETLPEPDEMVSSPESFITHEADGSPTKIRFNISWDSPEIATLCGTSIKFALKNGILELMTPINIPRLRKDEAFPSSGDETNRLCELCSTVAPTVEDFFRVRDHPACSPDCLVWANPYNRTGKVKSSFRNGKREPMSRDRKQLGRAAAPRPTGKLFNWMNYTSDLQCTLADVRAFQSSAPQASKFGQNNFTMGMWAEAVDPLHPYLYCLVEVVDCKAFRLRLHFTGYPDIYDFWVSQDSHFIFPPGWCFHNQKQLSPPKKDDKVLEDEEWQGMVEELAGFYCKFKSMFKNSLDLIADGPSASGLTGGHGFRIGQKLEAVDKSHPGFICVATVRDILYSRVLIHFDGWSDEYDYWTEPWSSLIFEVGHCERNGISINVPKGYNPAKFTWPRYLEETNSVAVPGHCFVKRIFPRESFKVNDRLEVVDPYCPRLIRVAQVLGVEDHHLRLSFDGWPTILNEFTEDLDSCNIFPPRYCERSEHPIVLPPGYCPAPDFQFAEATRNTNCSFKLCAGFGHVDANHSYHNRLADCPYRKSPLAKRLPDRLSGVASPLAEEERKSGCTNPGCDGKGHVTNRFATHLTISGCPNNRKRKKRKFSVRENTSSEENGSMYSPGSARAASAGPSSPETESSSREPTWPAQSDSATASRTAPRRGAHRYPELKRSKVPLLRRKRGSGRWPRKIPANQNHLPPGISMEDNLRPREFRMQPSEMDDEDHLDLTRPILHHPLSMDWENASAEIRSEISSLAQEIHMTICQRHVPPSPSMLRESRMQDFRKPLYDTTMSVHTVSDVTAAFGIDVETVPQMTCQQTQAMAIKLFGPDNEVAKMFEREQLDGAGLVLLNLEGFVKFLKMPLGSAVTLDGIVKLAREKCNLTLE